MFINLHYFKEQLTQKIKIDFVVPNLHDSFCCESQIMIFFFKNKKNYNVLATPLHINGKRTGAIKLQNDKNTKKCPYDCHYLNLLKPYDSIVQASNHN